jgi:hypothetical protein
MACAVPSVKTHARKRRRKMRMMELKAVKALRAYIAHMSRKEWAEAEIMLRRLRGILDRIGRNATMEEVATWLH